MITVHRHIHIQSRLYGFFILLRDLYTDKIPLPGFHVPYGATAYMYMLEQHKSLP